MKLDDDIAQVQHFRIYLASARPHRCRVFTLHHLGWCGGRWDEFPQEFDQSAPDLILSAPDLIIGDPRILDLSPGAEECRLSGAAENQVRHVPAFCGHFVEWQSPVLNRV